MERCMILTYFCHRQKLNTDLQPDATRIVLCVWFFFLVFFFQQDLKLRSMSDPSSNSMDNHIKDSKVPILLLHLCIFLSLVYFLNEIWMLCCCESSVILLFDAPTVWRVLQKAGVWAGKSDLQHSQTHNKGTEKKNRIYLVHTWLQWTITK